MTFGEKDHNKISIILDPKNVQKFNIVKTKTRELYEIELDYSDYSPFKNFINEQVIKGIEKFATNNSLTGSICKIIIKVKEQDLYYIDQSLIKNYILNKGIQYCTGVQVSAISNRQLRNSNINETLSGKKAMTSFIADLIENEQIKKKLLKYADKIIDEVESK